MTIDTESQATKLVWLTSKQGGSNLLILLAIARYQTPDYAPVLTLDYLSKFCRLDKSVLIAIMKRLAKDNELIMRYGIESETNQFLVTTGTPPSRFAQMRKMYFYSCAHNLTML